MQAWRQEVIEVHTDRIHEVQEGNSTACLLRTRPGGVLLKKDSGARTTAPRSAVCISCAATKPPFANENALNCSRATQIRTITLHNPRKRPSVPDKHIP